ncbi:MAG: MFS transporter [Saccharofermentanales bacterium]|nr:SLC45 family MFS transporter [Clostridiaceae bacterium]
MRLNYRKTFLIGFGFMANILAWSLYNSFVPLMLEERYIASTTIIGFIMTIDNIFGVIFQPLVGQLSDRTRTRIGRRMPYILFGVPVCAVLFVLIPMTRNLAAMMTVIILFNLGMSIWRSPVVALMPDMTPPAHRSKANGIINLMGGIGSIIAFVVGGMLVNLAGYNLPFLVGAIVMVLAVVILFLFIKEPDSRKLARQLEAREAGLKSSDIPAGQPDGNKQKGLHHLSGPEKRSLYLMLAAIFFWFCGYNAIEAFFTLYIKNTFNIVDTLSLALFSVSFVAFALPAGILAGRFGRKRLIIIGLAGIILIFIPMIFLENLLVMRILLLIAGVFWACININSLPMVVELASPERIGSFTGYYYFFSFSAAILSPTLFGLLRDLTQSYSILFTYSIAAFVLALICISLVRHGEAKADVSAVV